MHECLCGCMYACMYVRSLSGCFLTPSPPLSILFVCPSPPSLSLLPTLFLLHTLSCVCMRTLSSCSPLPCSPACACSFLTLHHRLFRSFALLLSQERGYVDLQSGDGKALGIGCDNCKCTPTVPTDAYQHPDVSPNAHVSWNEQV